MKQLRPSNSGTDCRHWRDRVECQSRMVRCYRRGAIAVRMVAALIAIAALVAQRGPFDEVHRMVRMLRSNDLHAAREAVAVFLGSNADTCDEPALVRAGTNHLAVQYLIGLVAAVFWFVLLGIPGLFAWRAVNVMGCLLDSSDPRQAYFGWVPTRFNDAAAYLPSLIAGLLIIVAAAFVPAANPV